MINKIRNVQELRVEKARHKLRVKQIEGQLTQDIENIGNSLKPGNILRSLVNEVKEPGFVRNLVTSSVGIGADLLLENYVFKNGSLFKGLRALFERLFSKHNKQEKDTVENK